MPAVADPRPDGPSNGWEPAPVFSGSNGPPSSPAGAPIAGSRQPARQSLMTPDPPVEDMLGRPGSTPSSPPTGPRGPRDHRSSGAGFQRVIDVLRRR